MKEKGEAFAAVTGALALMNCWGRARRAWIFAEVVVAMLGRGALMKSLGVDARDLIDARIDGGLSAIDRATERRQARDARPARDSAETGGLKGAMVYVVRFETELRWCNREEGRKTATLVGRRWGC